MRSTSFLIGSAFLVAEVLGSFHRVSHKHLQRYLYEFEYRFNRRKMPNLFEDAARQLVNTKEMKYRELIG